MSQTDKIVSKGMGVLKSTQARIEGLTGIFRQLAEEHGEATALLKRLVDADAERRAELFPLVRKELLSHERAELSELYSLLVGHVETRSIAEEHDQEAGEMESLINELSDQPYDDAMAFAGEIAGRNSDGVRGVKRLFNRMFTAGAVEQFAEERHVIASLIGTPNQVEAISANVEGRAPRFTGD